MEELKRNLQESIILHNLFISIYPKMIKEKDKEFFKFVRTHVKSNYTTVANAILDEVSVNLLKEIMVLTNQIWVDNPKIFDEAMKNDKRLYDSIRMQISNGEKFPFNNKELYKRIRQAIAHNSKDIQNFVYNLESFKLNLGKVDGKDYIINLEFSQMIKLLFVLLKNEQRENNPLEFVISETGTLKTKDEIFEKIKMVDGEQILDLDEYQIDRAYNYFNYVKPGQVIEGNEKEIKKVLCLPRNAERLFYDKISALLKIKKMTSGSCWNDFEMKDGLDGVNTYQAIISNLLFTIVASRTNDELFELFDGCIAGLDENKIRHIRNAFCHGTYFHNYNDNFYLYDGCKNLKFELRLRIKDINKILDKLAKGNFEVVALE